MINPEIFHAYDVRGIYPGEINEDAAYQIGQGFAQYTQGDIAVGRDARLSSPNLFKNFAKGFTDMGFNIMDLGVCTNPMVAFTVAHQNLKGGAVITASHSPGEYNGIKLLGEKANQLNAEKGMNEVKAIVLTNNFKTNKSPGKIKPYDILPEYQRWIKTKIGPLKDLNFVVDYGNGVGSIPAQPIFRELGLNPKELFAVPDGTFPNHLPNPIEEKNLEDLKKAVLENKAEFGVAFDGDVDRAVFINDKGQMVNPGFLLAAIATEELKKHPNEKIYYDLRFSKGVIKAIEKAGGIPIRTKVGNPFFKQQLIFEGGLMAAEYSSHIMYKEHYGLDDGLFSTLKVLYWLQKTAKKLSEFVGVFEKGYYLTGEINLEIKNSAAAIEVLEKKYADGEIHKMDGVTVEYPTWWFNLRASNTDPVVRLNIEADSPELLAEKKKELVEIIKKS